MTQWDILIKPGYFLYTLQLSLPKTVYLEDNSSHPIIDSMEILKMLKNRKEINFARYLTEADYRHGVDLSFSKDTKTVIFSILSEEGVITERVSYQKGDSEEQALKCRTFLSKIKPGTLTRTTLLDSDGHIIHDTDGIGIELKHRGNNP